jgi:hypothetical protein
VATPQPRECRCSGTAGLSPRCGSIHGAGLRDGPAGTTGAQNAATPVIHDFCARRHDLFELPRPCESISVQALRAVKAVHVGNQSLGARLCGPARPPAALRARMASRNLDMLASLPDEPLHAVLGHLRASELSALARAVRGIGVHHVELACARGESARCVLEQHVQRRIATMAGIDSRWVPCGTDLSSAGSWLRLLSEMETLASTPTFVRCSAHAVRSYNGEVASSLDCDFAGWGSAICGGRMRAGRHAIRLEWLQPGPGACQDGGFLYVGVAHAEFEPLDGIPACDFSSGHMFDVGTGLFRSGGQDSPTGLQSGDEGCTIGLLLDMDAGSLEVFVDQDDRPGELTRLGYLVRSGLRGPLAFAVDMYDCAVRLQATTADSLSSAVGCLGSS